MTRRCPHGWSLVVVAVALDVVAACALVLADGFERPWWLVPAYVFWAGTIGALALAMSTLDTGRAYPVFLGSSTVSVAAVGAVCFGDDLGWRGWAGILLITLGVVAVRLNSGTEGAP